MSRHLSPLVEVPAVAAPREVEERGGAAGATAAAGCCFLAAGSAGGGRVGGGGCLSISAEALQADRVPKHVAEGKEYGI